MSVIAAIVISFVADVIADVIAFVDGVADVFAFVDGVVADSISSRCTTHSIFTTPDHKQRVLLGTKSIHIQIYIYIY